MNRQLAAAIIASFHPERAASVRARFASFDERDWMHTRYWLHTSGMALYFLTNAKALEIADVIPARIRLGLEANLAQNRIRTQALFDEFARINIALQRAEISYLNLKGFTLVPRSCPDPAYRYQHDLDLLVSRRDAKLCRQVLELQNYKLTAISGDTWEFSAGPAEVATMSDLYKARARRSVELHLVPLAEQVRAEQHGDRLSRMQLQVVNKFEFPALSERDKLLLQAQHLFKHFQTEWTRTSWMLEYARAASSHDGDASFWQEVPPAIDAMPGSSISIGLPSLITSRVFGVKFPAEFHAATVDRIPRQLRLWADRYQDELVFVQHPGSKLYLLLQDVLWQDAPAWNAKRRKKLLPSRLPPSINATAQTSDLRLKMKTMWHQFCFVLKRLRFHVFQGARYKIESARWKRLLAETRA